MKIHYLSPEGVLDVEKGALLEIHRQLPGHWVAYAAFQLVPRNSAKPLDVDLVLLTSNRIVLVELKNWNGDIEYSDGQWFHKDGVHKSPVIVTSNKVGVLESVLRQRLAGKPTPIIDFVVVLCHPKCRLVGFPDEERKYTLTLSDFCAVFANQQRYQTRHPDVPKRPSPLDERSQYDSFFSLKNPQVKERKLVFHGFRQLSKSPDYVHPRGIWEEFKAEHIEVKRSHALLRKWDFHKVGDGATTAAERETIGLRELNLNERLRVQAPELHADLLEPVVPSTAYDLTTNFIEGYRLPERAERLSEFLARHTNLDLEGRLRLTRVILARFATLHLLGIAHRDITTNTLWVIEPSRVILSSFAAARVPDSRTVGVHRIELETGATKLPEDVDVASDTAKGAASYEFTRDVFLLGCIEYQVIEDKQLEYVSGVPVFDEKAELREPRLREWFASTLEWDQKSRYPSAQEALDTFNKALEDKQIDLVREEEILAYRTELSPLTLPVKEKISSLPGKVVYRSELNGSPVLVKCWPALKFEARNPARNARILSFLQQARSLRQSGFASAPQIVDFGISEFGLMLVTDWVEGVTLLEWTTSGLSETEIGEFALSLLNSVRWLHSSGLFHGDLKPTNILVSRQTGSFPKAVLLDVPDLSADGDEGVTPGALPAALEAATPQHRDAHITTELVLAILDGSFPITKAEGQRALEISEIIPPLDFLAETLTAELHPPATVTTEYVVKLRGRKNKNEPQWELHGDDAFFPVGIKIARETDECLFYVTGLRQQLVIKCFADDLRVKDVIVREISHDEYVLANKRSSFRLNATIFLHSGEEPDASSILKVLIPRYEATREDAQEEQVNTLKTSPYDGGETRTNSPSGVSTHALWEALTATDELNAFIVTLQDGARRTPEGDWLVPYDTDDVTVDFADEERIELLERGTDSFGGEERWFIVGIVKDVGKDLLQVTPTGFRFSPKQGKKYFLRGSLERQASVRRVAAMRRVIGGGALIPMLTHYFEPNTELTPKEFSFPSLDELSPYELNPLQEEALQSAIRYGPISLLQGPPGTGKTKFIASFVHYVLSNNSAKNILLVSQSHDAVNNALQKVRELTLKTNMDVSIVRVGLASMVPDSLRLVQEDARRQDYREKFTAEIKERIRHIGTGMGLPMGYVNDAIEIRRSLGDIVERIESLKSDSANNSRPGSSTDNHLQTLHDRFIAIASSKFDWHVNTQVNLREQLDNFMDDVASRYGTLSPEKRRRFDQVIRLSSEFSNVLRNPRSNFTAFLARSAQLVSGTCVGVGKHALGIVDGAYDWVIVDEAARASPMEFVVALQAGKRILLVGDHLQLPPSYSLPVQDKTAQILGISRSEFRSINSFQRAFFSSYGKQVGRTLLKQYRMANAISRLVSNCFYEEALKVGREAPGPEYNQLPGYLNREVVWIDTADFGRDSFHQPASKNDEGALINELEANLVVQVVRDILQSRPLVELALANKEVEPIIGVITMYAAQRDLIRKKLDQAEWASDARGLFTVGTVDSYQGKENRVIILSIVRNDSSPTIGFLRDPERINVAMSRAKDRLVIIGSTSMWNGRSGTPMNRVLKELEVMESLDLCSFVSSKQVK